MQFQTAIFDTHAFVQRLTGLYERLATKEPFDFTLKHDLEKFRAELKYEIHAVEHRLTIKLGAIIIIGMTVLKAILA